MTRARAPGKVVLSGAYAVLAGAPAIVSAVSRYVTADSARVPELVTAEVQAALSAGQTAPWFDASALREDGRKLGLGSSAAILVASLYALESAAEPSRSAQDLRQRVFERALVAHRLAQAGGSGVDVASCSFGGTLCYRLSAGTPLHEPLRLPRGLSVELWTCPEAANTRELLAAVAALAERAPADHRRLLGAQGEAAEHAVRAASADDAAGFVAALRAQQRALSALGRAAGVSIVTDDLGELGPSAEAEQAVLLPAGAGGGDMAIFVGPERSSVALRTALSGKAHRLLDAELSAAGVTGAPAG